jgi:hypothetical protein
LALIPHPLGGLAPEAVAERAAIALPRIIAALTTPPPPAEEASE